MKHSPPTTTPEPSVILAADLPVSKPLRRFLDQAAEDPDRAYRNRRIRSPDFCRRYFDLCDANALECDRNALEQPDLVLGPARIALELAERSGDPHLVNESLGVLAHAHVAVEQPVEAWAILEGYRKQATRCCARCKSAWLRRHGDYLVEVGDGAAARRSLAGSLRAASSLDEAGRVAFVHGISRFLVGQREAAFEDELRVLETLDLASPRGYFIDALAFLAIFLRGADPAQDRRALRELELLKKRIADVRDWSVVRHRLRWVEGQLHARLGNLRGAADRLDTVRRALLKSGPVRYAVAVTVDLAQIYCRHNWGDNIKNAARMIQACLDRLPADATGEEAAIRQGLKEVLKIFDRNPERGFDALVAFRSTLVVATPGIVAERMTTGWDIVVPGQHLEPDPPS